MFYTFGRDKLYRPIIYVDIQKFNDKFVNSLFIGNR